MRLQCNVLYKLADGYDMLIRSSGSKLRITLHKAGHIYKYVILRKAIIHHGIIRAAHRTEYKYKQLLVDTLTTIRSVTQ